MAIQAYPSSNFNDLTENARKGLYSWCSNPKFLSTSGTLLFSGLSMMAGALVLAGASLGLAVPIAMGALTIGAGLCVVGVVMGLLYGINKLLPDPKPTESYTVPTHF